MSAAKGGLVIAGEPRVQLLPPSVRRREKAREARRLLALALVLVLVLCGGGISFAYLTSVQAAQRLADAQAQTAQIITQQGEYADGAHVASMVSTTEAAQLLLTSGEIDWSAVYAQLGRYLPAESAFTGFEVTAPAPWEPALVPAGALRAQGVATVLLTIASGDYSLAAAFAAAVIDHPAVADVRIVASTLDGVTYLTQVSVTLNGELLMRRFDPTAMADDESEEEPAQQPAGAATEESESEGEQQ
jgi:hypothetical protein